jgi:hypothetical protein
MTRSFTLVRRLGALLLALSLSTFVALALSGGPAAALVPPPEPTGDPGAPAHVLAPIGPAAQSTNTDVIALLVIAAVLVVLGVVAWARQAHHTHQGRTA